MVHIWQEKKTFEKKNHNYFEHAKELLKYHQFASSFEQWNFKNNGSLKETKINNPNYFASLMIFQRYKIAPPRLPSMVIVVSGNNFK